MNFTEKGSILAVAPLVGAWIEIFEPGETDADEAVAPLVGAWIEISISAGVIPSSASLLSWERGLKSPAYRNPVPLYCRSSRGSVD